MTADMVPDEESLTPRSAQPLAKGSTHDDASAQRPVPIRGVVSPPGPRAYDRWIRRGVFCLAVAFEVYGRTWAVVVASIVLYFDAIWTWCALAARSRSADLGTVTGVAVRRRRRVRERR